MNRLLVLSLVALPLAIMAQSEPLDGASYFDVSMLTRHVTPDSPEGMYDSILNDGYVYSGIVVQLMRAPQPLQLINPWAPQAYGTGENNLVLDPIDNHPTGLKLFAISF